MRNVIVSLIAASLLVAPVGGSAPDLERHRLALGPGNLRAEAAAYQDRRGPEVTESFSRRVRLAPGGRVSLSNISGLIVVSGEAGDDVSIEATKRTRGDRSLLSAVRIDVEERAGRISIRTVYPNNRGRREEGVSVDYTLRIPALAAIDVSSVSGSVRVSDVKGAISAEAISGNVTVSGASRIENASTVSGTVELTDSTLDAETEASTVSGLVRLRDVRGRRIALNSVSGRIEAIGLSSDRLDTQSVSGRIDFSGQLSPNGRYSLGSHSGSVRISLQGNTGFELDASSFSGSIRSDLPARAVQTSRGNSGRSRGSQSLRASVGDGSATLRLQTFSGSIVIERR